MARDANLFRTQPPQRLSLCPSVRPYVNVGRCLCGGYCRRPSVCVVCLRGILSVYHCGCLPCRCGSFVCVCHRVSVRLSTSVTGIRLGSRVSRSRLLGRETEWRWQPGAAGRGGGGDSGRGRGRRVARSGCVRGAEGGGCQTRLSLRQGTSAASSPRRGTARPGLAASGESPAPPGTLPRPVAYSASGGRCTPEGSKPPNRTPAAPPGLPSDALHRPTLILNSSLAAADLRSPAREPAPRRAGRRLFSIACGDPGAPLPPLVPKSGATGRCPLLGAEPGLRRFLEPSWAHLIPATPAPRRSAQPKPPPRSRRLLPTGTPSLFGGKGRLSGSPEL